jgi:hypothetical protein
MKLTIVVSGESCSKRLDDTDRVVEAMRAVRIGFRVAAYFAAAQILESMLPREARSQRHL